jgi:flagellar assembly protein FliH
VEPTLFKPDPSPPKQRHWLDDTWLNSASRPIPHFGEFDWVNLPILDYASVRFRQISVPEDAKVFDEDSGFVLETFGRPSQPTTARYAHGDRSHEPDPSASTHAKDEAHEPEADVQTQAMQAEEAAQALALVRAKAEAEREAQRRLEQDVFGPECMWRHPDADEDWQDALALGDDLPVIDPAALAAAREEAFAQGHAQGVTEGQSKGHEEGMTQGVEEGMRQGLEKAQDQSKAEIEAALAEQKTQMSEVLQTQLHMLEQLQQQWQAFIEEPQALYEPLKRLALHISEQLVLAELTLSGQAIERLVQRCLDEIDWQGQSIVTVELHPQDKARLEELGAEVIKQMQLQAVHGLNPGSVRLVVNDSQIEDLVEHRLQAIANRLLNQPEVWREQSAFFRQPLAQRDGQVQDVAERVAYDPNPDEGQNA